MRKCLSIALAIAVGLSAEAAVYSALAAPTVENPEPHITIFRDGDHSVTLVGKKGRRPLATMAEVINEKDSGQASLRNRSPVPTVDRSPQPSAASKEYWVRVRFAGGRFICEKFAELPAKQPPAERAAELFRESCN